MNPEDLGAYYESILVKHNFTLPVLSIESRPQFSIQCAVGNRLKEMHR